MPTIIAVAAAFAAFSILLPVIPLAVISHGGTDTLAGMATGVFMAVTVATQLITNRLVQRFGFRPVMLVAALLLGLPALWHMFSFAAPSVLVVAGLRGIGFGALCVAQYALVGQLVPAGMLGKASGLIGVFVGASQMVFLPVGLWLLDAGVSMNIVLLLAAAVALLAAVMCIWIPSIEPERPEPWSPEHDPAVKKVSLRRRVTMRVVRRPRRKGMKVTIAPAIALASVSMGYGAVSSFLPASVREADPISGASIAGMMLSIVGLAQLVSRYISGSIADRQNKAGLGMLPGLALSSVGMAGMCAVIAWGLPLWLLIMAAVCFGAGFGLVQNDALLEMFLRVPRERLGSASTVWNASFDTGTGIGAITLGMVAASHGYTGAFLCGAILVMLGITAEVIDRVRRSRALAKLSASEALR
ncbi:MFS transporter [Corynebacterium pelargi]|uniref:Putative transporter n=1 Tax=Corynebacterium pelargi TaxID=1471400 RepID=A0A410W7Y9_9CORY|nr:MFS transporter [Corynebacterium pelargi]QAU52077.1 putative transporter [Corynebacterium pelargi]GGG70298.1 MFS transporter [Corynebacterium pelargi]